jgi:glycosyltransferase involved in cell wall biosynthesis
VSKSLSNPVLSIVTVSAYDVERLKITLSSLVVASDLSLEHVTVLPEDDLASIELWEQLCGHIPNFRLVYDRNSGIYPAMNLGANFAKGDFVVFWNGGEEINSVFELDSLLECLPTIEANIVITQGKIEWLPSHRQSHGEYEGFMLGEPGKFISHQTYLIRLKFFHQLGGFNEKYKVVSDTELMLQSYSRRTEVVFSEFCPVFVQNSVYASSHQRLLRWEMLRVNFAQALRSHRWNRIRNFLRIELESFTKKLSQRLEISNVGPAPKKFLNRLENRVPYSSNFGREVVLNRFISQIVNLGASLKIDRINVVGGSVNDPEAVYLKSKFPNAEITTYGIENSDFYLNLNLVNSIEGTPGDIVLVSQVLEHIWCHDQFFRNVVKLAKVDGYIWIGCPASNKVHGSPEYFGSGFTSAYLQNNLQNIGTEIIDSGFFGTKRLYLATHWIPSWLSVRAHKLPLLCAFNDFRFIERVLLSLRYFGQLLVLSVTNPRPASNERWATEAWVLARRL